MKSLVLTRTLHSVYYGVESMVLTNSSQSVFYGMESVVLSMTLHSVYKCVESMVLTNTLHSVYCGVESMVLTNDEAKRKSATHCRKSCWETLENVRTLAFTPKQVSPWVLIAALKVKVDNAAAGGHPVKDFF